jgi:hypothetical protein
MPIDPPELPDDDEMDEICDLRLKIDMLDAPRKRITDKTGISETQLKSDAHRGSMSRGRQRRLSAAYGFSIAHQSWRNPTERGTTSNDKRKDNSEQFSNYLRSLRRPAPVFLAGPTRPALDEDFAKVRLEGLTTQYPSNEPAGLALLDQGDFEPRDIGAGMKMGLARFRLIIGLPKRDGVSMRRDEKQRRDLGLQIEARGTDERPKFDFIAETPPLRGRWPSGEVLGLCRGLAVGDTLEVVALARFDDAVVDFVDCAAAPLDHVWKEKLRIALAKREALGNPDLQGWALLCKQTISVAEGT